MRQAAAGSLSPQTPRWRLPRPASQPVSQPTSRLPQDKCFYICNQKHNTHQDVAGAALDSGSLTILCFNKYQTQTRLGASSLRNVSEGSTITHNKWAYANTGLFVMHKSLFGVCGSDAVCWYAIILKSIKVQVWVCRLVGAVGDVLSICRLPQEYSMNREHQKKRKLGEIRGSRRVW